MGRSKTGIVCHNNSQDHASSSTAYHLKSITFPGTGMNLQFFSPLVSNSELDMTTHDVFSKNGREKVGVFSPMLISMD